MQRWGVAHLRDNGGGEDRYLFTVDQEEEEEEDEEEEEEERSKEVVEDPILYTAFTIHPQMKESDLPLALEVLRPWLYSSEVKHFFVRSFLYFQDPNRLSMHCELEEPMSREDIFKNMSMEVDVEVDEGKTEKRRLDIFSMKELNDFALYCTTRLITGHPFNSKSTALIEVVYNLDDEKIKSNTKSASKLS